MCVALSISLHEGWKAHIKQGVPKKSTGWVRNTYGVACNTKSTCGLGAYYMMQMFPGVNVVTAVVQVCGKE